MNLEKLENVKALYYPYKAMKKITYGLVNYGHYIGSLYYIKKNRRLVKKKIDSKDVLNVIFVIQYIPGWNKLEPIYWKMKKDKSFNPIILCVPLNIQNHKLIEKNKNDIYDYFLEHGYEAINAINVDGSWVELKQFNPDYVFHSRPYNSFMPECYTSGRIVKYALICNVLYGASVTTDMRTVTINKNYFRDVYCYFAVDKGECEFFRKRFWLGFFWGITKCFPFGAIGLEQILNAKSEKRYDDFRKTIIWAPRWSTDEQVGGSNFFNYKDIILDFAKENQDVLFIIRPHPLMFNNFIKTGEMTKGEVKEFKKYCELERNIILNEDEEYTDTFWASDLLISDVSSIVPEYFVTEKPVIYCHSSINFNYEDYAEKMIHSCYEAHNSEELKKYICEFLDGIDKKLYERKNYLNSYWGSVQENSSNILQVLEGKL